MSSEKCSESGRDDHNVDPEVPTNQTSNNVSAANRDRLKLRNLQYNRRKWRKVKDMAKKWIENQGSTVVPFVVMRLNKGVLEWAGPSFMRGFAEDEEIINRFKEAAFTRPVSFIRKDTDTLVKTKRATKTCEDVHDLRSLPVASLRRLLTRICNPLGHCGFWQNPSNKPSWWPSEVHFQSPNWVPGGGSKLRWEHLIRVLESHKDHPSSSETSQPPPTSPDQPSTSVGVLQKLNNGDYRSCLSTLHALPWEELQVVCSDLLPHLTAMKPRLQDVCMADFPANMIDDRRCKLSRIPKNFAALHSTGDGDCLFHSLSILIDGTEQSTLLIRLAAAVYGVCHADHYVSMYLEECDDLQAAWAFLHMMGAHPPPDSSGWTEEEIISFTIRDQAAATAQIKSYSGILQVLFSAGFLRVFIQQYSEDRAPGYDSLLNPCACEEQDGLSLLNLMWVRSSSSGAMNHFVPLVARRAQSRCAPHRGKKFNLGDVAENFCTACLGAFNMCQADALYLNTWIECDECHRWYHCLCTGVAHAAAEKMSFVCCSLECMTSVTKINGQTITIADINRLRNVEDLSGETMDFFLRHLINSSDVDAIALPYFVGQLLQSNSWLQTLPDNEAIQRMAEHLHGAGYSARQIIDGNVLLFPVCFSNHWIGLAVQPKKRKLHILDSLQGFFGADVYHRLHKFVSRYLLLISHCAGNQTPNEEPLGMEVSKVIQQDNSHDCGVYLLANFEVFLNGDMGEFVDGVKLRRSLIALVHEYTSKMYI